MGAEKEWVRVPSRSRARTIRWTARHWACLSHAKSAKFAKSPLIFAVFTCSSRLIARCRIGIDRVVNGLAPFVRLLGAGLVCLTPSPPSSQCHPIIIT